MQVVGITCGLDLVVEIARSAAFVAGRDHKKREVAYDNRTAMSPPSLLLGNPVLQHRLALHSDVCRSRIRC